MAQITVVRQGRKRQREQLQRVIQEAGTFRLPRRSGLKRGLCSVDEALFMAGMELKRLGLPVSDKAMISGPDGLEGNVRKRRQVWRGSSRNGQHRGHVNRMTSNASRKQKH